MKPKEHMPIIIESSHVPVIKARQMPNQRIDKISALLKVLADPTRLKIIDVLKTHELCVADIALVLDMTHSAVSHQLKILKEHRLVVSHRQGKAIIYRIHAKRVHDLLKDTLNHVEDPV